MQTLPKVFNSYKNIFCKILLRYFNVKRMLKSGHAMKWNGKWYGMEREFCVEYGRCSEWNGRFGKLNGRSSSILPY